MPDISLTDPTSIVAEINRRQRLADLLQQQSLEPIPTFSSGRGMPAPIPWTAVLAKALQGGLAGYESHKAEGAQRTADQRAQALLSAYNAPQGPPQAQGLPPQVRNDDYGAMAGLPPPMPRPQPMAAPPPVNAPIATPPQMPAQAPQAGPTSPSPVAPPPVVPPVPAPIAQPPAPVDAMAAQEAAAQAQLSKALELQQQMVALGHPKAADAHVETAKRNLERIQTLRDTEASKEQDRLRDRQDAVDTVSAIPGLNPQQQQIGATMAQHLGTKGIEPILAKIASDQFGTALVPATADDLKGRAPGTVALKDPNTNKLFSIYDPTDHQDRAEQLKQGWANVGLHAKEVALSGARLGLESQRFAFDKEQKSNALLDPSTIQQMAMQARAGDKSVFQNLGRGTQGAQNIVALRRAIFDPALGPMTGAQMAQMNAQFLGAQSAARAAGTRAGQAAVGAEEVPLLAQQSNDAYSKLTRDQLVPFNKLRLMVEQGTSSPQQADSFAADEAVITAWSRTLTPTGAPTDARQKLGERILSQAVGQDAHRAVLNRFISEINAVKKGANIAVKGGSAPAAQLTAPGGLGGGPASKRLPSESVAAYLARTGQ